MNTTIVLGADGARAATGVVVVLDLMRAFTTAAYAFGAGISEIELVSASKKPGGAGVSDRRRRRAVDSRFRP